ncbi:MAG: hypothetical protein ACI8V5_004101, partial [Limisphaerales bacterium]
SPLQYPAGIIETLASLQDFDMGSRGLSPHQLFGFLRTVHVRLRSCVASIRKLLVKFPWKLKCLPFETYG